MRARPLAGVAFVTAAVSLTAACGGGDGGSPSSGIDKAVSVTKGEGTATFSVAYKEAGRPLIHGAGAVDFPSYRGKSTMDFGGGPPYRSVWDSSGVYVSTAGITLLRGERTLKKPPQHWVKAPAGYEFQLVGPLKMLDLPRVIDLLGIGDERDVGRQQGFRHFKGSLAFDRFVKVFLPPFIGKALLDPNHAPVPVEAWVDSTNHIRRISYSVPALAQDARAARATFVLRDFGRPVDVSLPPADDVIDIRSLDPVGGSG
jgi:hypothetical protein